VYVDGKPHNGSWSIALGAVHCSFKKEIKPYESYEMWTRVLAWDRKWLYIVTHFVKKGAVKPDGFVLDDGTIVGARKKKTGSESETEQAENGNVKTNGHPKVKSPPSNAVFATAVSKYVVKLGRLTVHPEVSLASSNLLPPRPGGWNTMQPKSATLQEDISASSTFEKVEGEGKEVHVDVASGGEEWNWERIVAQNEKGLEFANHFAAMDGLHETFGEEGPVLGVYTDLFF